MGLTSLSIHVSRCNKSDPGRQGPDGFANPVPGAPARAEPGKSGRDRGSGSMPAPLSLARLGTDRAEVDGPAFFTCAGPSTATPDGGSCHRTGTGRTWTTVAAVRVARIRAARATRDAGGSGQSLRVVGGGALERASQPLARERGREHRPAFRARLAHAVSARVE